MKMPELLNDYNISYQTDSKNCSPGWVSMQCPFCDDHSDHLGYSLQAGFFKCWRCGWHSTVETISKLTGLGIYQSLTIIKQYGGTSTVREKPPAEISRNFRFPFDTSMNLQRQHIQYLESRGFDTGKLQREWKLMGTGPVAYLDGKDYRHRILAPIYWYHRIVSFQTRDITGKVELRYKTCPKDREVVHHKHILYGQQDEWGDVGLCVEGITDVWRLGPKAFATFGINFSVAQVRQMAKAFKRVVILFDPEPRAQAQAHKLVNALILSGVRANTVDTLPTDPASLSQEDANHLVKQCI